MKHWLHWIALLLAASALAHAPAPKWIPPFGHFDANGNTTSLDGTWQYDWADRLTNYNNGTATYTYDGDGHRIKKTAGGVTTWYLVATVNPSGWPQVVEEHTGSSPGTLSRRYTYGLDLISQSRWTGSAWETHFYLTDGLGSTRALLNTGGAISDTYTYDAWGNLIASTGTTPNDYLFAGEQWDGTIGQYYLRARTMHPGYGRFWTRDTHEGTQTDPPSLHKYLYAHANPVNLTDPSGQSALGDVVLSISIRVYLFAQTHATIINAARVGLTTLTLGLVAADSAGLLTSDRSIVGIYLSSGGNPFAEATYVIGEIRTLRTAIVAARTVPSVIQGFTQAETAVINEARQILNSAEFAQLKAAKEAGRSLRVTINGRTIQYEAGAPWSGFTWAEQRGFVLGDEAFSSEAELAKTVLHELHRLSVGTIVPSGSISVASPTAKETLDAYQFAEKAAKEL